MMNKFMTTTAISLIAGATALSANAADVDPRSDAYSNNSPITITGVVSATEPDGFELRYGTNTIEIEMDDWDWRDEAQAVNKGDKVTVYGNIDHDLFETRKIEADSLYSHNRNAYFFASGADEEDTYTSYNFAPTRVTIADVPEDAWVGMKGIVEDIDGREFTLVTKRSSIVIDTDEMSYNPLDDEGYQQVKAGDIVYVSGEMDRDFFEEKEIDAKQIVTLHKTEKKS